MYVQSIVELYHQFCKQYQNDGHQDIPLVINTHGWLKGTPLLGQGFISTCLRSSQLLSCLTHSLYLTICPLLFTL